MDNWKEQLKALKLQMEAEMTEEERRERELEKQRARKRTVEIDKRRIELYKFLASYKQNSGIFVNNFFRKRDFKTYVQDKFHCFDFNVSGWTPNIFDDPTFSFAMVRYLSGLEKRKIAYHPINSQYMSALITFSEVLDLLNPLEEDTILYRGCSTLERNGVNGIVSTTTDFKVAEQFSRGTILKIHVPKGTKCLNVKDIRPKSQRKNEGENEVLLPPCDYQIISQKEVKRGREPNNHTGKTKIVELFVQPLDLLTEFLKVTENPPEEYLPLIAVQGEEYFDSIEMLRDYLQKREEMKTGKEWTV